MERLRHLAYRQQVLAELRVAVNGLARMLGAMFLPQQHQRHAFASQLLVNAAIVGLHETADSPGGAQHSVVQCRVVQALDLNPVQTGRCGQRHILGDHAFGDAQGGGASLMGEPGFKFETKYVPYLAHIDPSGIGHAYFQQSWQGYPEGYGNMRNITRCVRRFRYRDRSFRSRDRSFRSTLQIGHDRPESLFTINQNRRSRSAGMTGHGRPEYPANTVVGERSFFSHLLQRPRGSHSTWSALVHVANALHRTSQPHGGLVYVLAIGAVMIKRLYHRL